MGKISCHLLIVCLQPLSKEILDWVADQLRLSIPAAAIVDQNQKRFIEEFRKENKLATTTEACIAFLDGNPPRDFYLNDKDVYNVKRKRIDIEWMLHPDPQLSAQEWFNRLPSEDQLVFSLAQPIEGTPDHAQMQNHGPKSKFKWNAANWTPFIIAFCFAASIAAAVECNGKPLLMDATHGTNAQQFPLATILGVDSHKNGRPLAWKLCTSETEKSYEAFLLAFYTRVSQPCSKENIAELVGLKDFGLHFTEIN